MQCHRDISNFNRLPTTTWTNTATTTTTRVKSVDEVVDDEVDDGKGLRTVMTTTKSPTMPDAQRWAFGEFFYFFLTNKCFIVYTVYILHNTRQDGDKDEKEPKWRKTRVVWAIREFSFLTNFLLYVQAIIYAIHNMEGVGRWRRRERAQTTPDVRRLGHRWMIFFHLHVFFYTNKCFIIYTGYNLWNTQRDGGNPMGLRKPTTRTRENPHPRSRVWVSTGTGAGCPGKPQGSPSHSLCVMWQGFFNLFHHHHITMSLLPILVAKHPASLAYLQTA